MGFFCSCSRHGRSAVPPGRPQPCCSIYENAQDRPHPTIIPGLPDELAMCCLAWLPSGRRPLARSVSRSWLRALQPSVIESARHRLGISETKVFACLAHIEHQKRFFTWFILDPLLSACKELPPPPIRQDELFCGAIVIDGKQVLYVGSEGTQMFTLDVFTRTWKPLFFSVSIKISAFATGWLDGYLYMAGGFDENLEPLKSAKRLKLETGELEDIKDMNSGRASSAGVVLQGMFCVIGGCHKGLNDVEVHDSAEVWDPSSQEWTLVHEMWPHEIFGKMELPMVAVVSDQLYALRAHKRELMWYDSNNKVWESLSYLPAELCNPNFPHVFGVSQMTGLLAVGRELWVTVHCTNDIFVLAAEPSIDHNFTWRRLPFCFSDFTSITASIAVTV